MIKNSKRVSAYTSCFMEYCLKEICPLLSSGAVNVPFISVSKLVNLKSGFFTNPKSLSLATMLPSSYSLLRRYLVINLYGTIPLKLYTPRPIESVARFFFLSLD